MNILLVILLAVVGVSVLLAFVGLKLYCAYIRTLPVSQNAEETILTYPLV